MIDNLLNFKQWIKEQAVAAAPTAPSSPVAPASSGMGSATTGATLSSDVAKVPTRIGCGKDCGKDFFKNWHYKKKRKK